MARALIGATELDLYSFLLILGGLFFAGFAAWLLLRDRRASQEAAMRPQPLRRPGRPERFRLPGADETRLSVARFRRVISEWFLVEYKVDQLRQRADALKRKSAP